MNSRNLNGYKGHAFVRVRHEVLVCKFKRDPPQTIYRNIAVISIFLQWKDIFRIKQEDVYSGYLERNQAGVPQELRNWNLGQFYIYCIIVYQLSSCSNIC